MQKPLAEPITLLEDAEHGSLDFGSQAAAPPPASADAAVDKQKKDKKEKKHKKHKHKHKKDKRHKKGDACMEMVAAPEPVWLMWGELTPVAVASRCAGQRGRGVCGWVGRRRYPAGRPERQQGEQDFPDCMVPRAAGCVRSSVTC